MDPLMVCVSCQVIIKLCDQVTAFMSDPGPSVSSCGGDFYSQSFRLLQQDVKNLKVSWSLNGKQEI